MAKIQKKQLLLFLIGCIGTRLALVYTAKNVSADKLQYLGYLALLPAIGWLYIYFISPRNTGPEVFGGKIWWNELRPIHAMLYILFAIYAIQKKPNSYLLLLIDVVFGLSAFLMFHFFLK
jgi:hypothetical protein